MAIKTIIERSVSGQNDWTVLTNDAEFPVSFVDDTAVEDVTYDYRARLQDGDNLSPYSSIRTIKTLSSVTAPDAPTSLIATAMSKNQISLTWVAPSNTGGSPIIGYKIERRVGTSGSWGTLVANTASTSTAWNDGGLNPSTQYQYRVYALNSIGQSVASTVSSATTHQDATAPNPPIGLAAEAISHDKINLTWITPSDGGSAIIGYMIERRLGTGTWTVIVSNTYSEATTYLSEGLATNTEYSFRVSAINAIGTSSPSVAATASTYVTPSPITVSDITSDSAKISWSDFSPSARGYVVQVSLVNYPEQNELFINLTDLTPDTSYTVRVYAIGTNGEVIGQTPYETFATYPEQNELAPDNISIGSITDNSATVTWDAPEVGELGFNVYLGGVKKNTSLITDEYYNLIDLLPGTVYNVVVSAVYTDNEESSNPIQFSTTGESIGLERNFQETFTVTGGGLYDGQEILVDFYIPLWLRENPSWAGDVPYVVWCHGDGEVGFSISKLREGAGYPRFISQGDDFPYVIISPQARSPLWSVEFVDKVILFAKTIIPQINENKVGVAGWSGGKPPYMYLNEAPERLAVSLPFSVASGVASENVCASIENGNRVWVFVAKDDPLGTGGHLTYFNNLKNCSSYDPLRHKMTYYTSGGHDCVTRSIRQSPTGGAVEPGYSAVVGGNVHNFIMAAFDEKAPSVPEGLAVVSKTNSNIAVSWEASEDDYAGVSHYVPNIDNVDQTPTTSLSFNFTGLENNTEYDIKVKAVDNNGNESAYSEILKVTTDEFGSPWSPAFDSQDLRISTVEGGITKSGTTLTSVEDLSERGNDINLSGSPAIVTGLNSIDAIHFRELNDERITIPNAAHLNYTDSQFIGIVAQVDFSLTPDQWAAIVAKGDSTQYQVRRNSNQTNLFYQTGGTSPDNSSTFSPGTNWAIIVACLHNGRKIFRVNGSVISDAAFTGSMSANSFPVSIPGPADKNRFMELKLHELIIASGRDTDVIEKYEGWLAEQYDLRSVLPSEHPYKSVSPLT